MHDSQPPAESDVSDTDIERVGEQEVVPTFQWVPGDDPHPWVPTDPNRGHWEQFVYCLRCGTERLSRDQYSTSCPGEHPTADESTAGDD